MYSLLPEVLTAEPVEQEPCVTEQDRELTRALHHSTRGPTANRARLSLHSILQPS